VDVLRRAGEPMTARQIADALIADQAPQATRKQAIDLQATILAALRKRDGVTVVGIGAPARWKLSAPWSGVTTGKRILLKFANSRLRNLGYIVRISTGVNDLSKISMEAELQRIFLKFLSDESGATAIEYGLIAAGISLAIIAVVNGLGTNLNEKFTSINSSLK
jgi:pilus assembly protein Flp/PilA